VSALAGRTGPGEEDARTADATPLFVVGSSGMLAGELLRLVADHPALSVAGVVSREPGRALVEMHPHLAELSVDGAAARTTDLAAATAAIRAAAERGPVAVALGLPHGAAAEAWRGLRAELGSAADAVVAVDLSADYRLADVATYRAWYGKDHGDPEGLGEFVYALPELAPEPLAGRTRLSAPGCFATALQLATWPAARAGLLDAAAPWRYSAVTGSSGSGVTPTAGTHHPFRDGNLWAYGLGGHRHEAELAATLARLELAPEICFLPHSGPFARGIHLTAMLPLAAAVDVDAARAAYRDAYAGRPFVRVEDGAPDLRRVVGSNSAAIGVFARGRTLVVLVTLDNMMKGGAGQALQALNLALGRPETLGLPRAGLGVV
jgi:N-acetyl-gamma-glutamyl-phosphate reductase